MNRQPRSWAASVVGLALALLVAGVALDVAVRLLVSALPVLVGVAAAMGAGWLVWRWLQRRDAGW